MDVFKGGGGAGEGGNPLELVTLTSAHWKYYGRIDRPNEGTSVNVKLLLDRSMQQRWEFDVRERILGPITGLNDRKSLDLQLSVEKALIHLRLTEGSRVARGVLTPEDETAQASRIGKTALELISAKWSTTTGDIGPYDKTEAYLAALKKGPVTVEPPLFNDFAPGRGKALTARFRIRDQYLEICLWADSTMGITGQ